MAAAQNKLHAAMIYVLAVTLCLMYTGDTVVVAYSYRFVASNPPSSKLLFLAELLKLVLSGLLLLAEKYSKRDSQQDQQQSVKSQLLPHADAPADAQPAVKRSPRAVQLLAALQALLMFAVPAVCYFITNK